MQVIIWQDLYHELLLCVEQDVKLYSPTHSRTVCGLCLARPRGSGLSG